LGLVGVGLGALLVLPRLRFPLGELGLRGLECAGGVAVLAFPAVAERVCEEFLGAAVTAVRRAARTGSRGAAGGLELDAWCAVLSLRLRARLRGGCRRSCVVCHLCWSPVPGM